MTPSCIASQYGCSCAPGECQSRAVKLERFTKPRPAPCNPSAYSYALVGLFALLVSLWGISEGLGQQRVIDRDQQEIVSWER